MKKKKVSVEEARFLWDMGVKVYVFWQGSITPLLLSDRDGYPPDDNSWWRRKNKAPRFWVEVE